MELEEIFQSGWEVCLSPNAFVLSAPSKPEAFNLAYCKPETLAEWALRFGRGATLIKYPQCGDSYYRIPAAMANSLQVVMNSSEPLILDPGNPLIEVYSLSLSPVLYRAIGWFLEHPVQAGGIVRVADNQQVAMSHANAQKDSDFTAGAGVKRAVKWKRSDFWHPGDLADFEREWRQKLEPNNPDSWIEVSWRSFDPDLGMFSPDSWIEFVQENLSMPMPGRKDVPNSASDLPPKLPSTSEALQRAILLLGNQTKTELTDKSRRELEQLLGTYPSAEQAGAWKQRLKQLVKQRS